MNNQTKDYDYMFKLVLLGSSGVGKSNILLKFTRNEFIEGLHATIGVQYATKTVQASNKKRIKFQIWDTAGQQQYKALMKTFYKGATAAILTYDITHQKSFHDLQYWYQQIRQYCKSDVVVMLVGNKSDMQSVRQVSKQDGLTFAQKNRIAFYQVSAKTGSNIELIFGKIADQLQKIMLQSERIKNQTMLKSTVQTKSPIIPKVQKQQSLKINRLSTIKKTQKKSCCK